ncbi:amino acid transporter heavy chain SLC3A2 isoform X1 [Atheta coriaria]|uniref:amino acid transporter heavy chain SLC3A2 isoform X1 n=1 Tax=Dalotia coriaria TaxID=877792 RepID=UPI0031F44960
MEGTKLDIAAKEKEPLSPSATYKQIPEDDMEGKAKNVVQESNGHEPDGADEKMLSKEDTKVSSNSKISLTEVKFTTNEKNGDAKLDIGEVKGEFVGLTKEELMKCANDPFWVRLRWFLFIVFWLLWAGMLIGAIMIIVAAPKCTPPQPKTWWEQGPLRKLDDIKSEITNELASTNHGFILTLPHDTYAPLNTTPGLEAFLQNNKDRNIIIELNPTVSDVWFTNSEGKTDDYVDYYIWRGQEGAQNDPPNNWLAKASTDELKKSAWVYSETRKQFYYAPEGAPHLNFRNPKVEAEFKAVLSRYIDAGVDGFMLKNVPGLLVDEAFKNEGLVSTPANVNLDDYRFYTHTRTENLEEVQPIVRQWRDIIKNKTNNGVLMLSDELTSLKPYKHNGTLLVDLPKHRNAFDHDELTAPQLVKEIEGASTFLEHNWPAWNIAQSSYPDGTLEVVAYLLKGSPILNKNFEVTEDLKEARSSPSVLFGVQKLYTAANDTIFAYTRTYPGNPGYLVAFNPTDYKVVVDFAKDIPEIPEEFTVQHFTSNYNETNVELGLKKPAHDFPISPKSAIILSYVPKAAE